MTEMSDAEITLSMGYDPDCNGYGPDRCTNACEACGYIQHDIPSASDEGHDALCCGSKVCTETNPDMPCYGHMEFSKEQ